MGVEKQHQQASFKRKEIDMNNDLRKAKWRQMRGKVKQLKAKLTNNRRGRISGQYDVLVGELEEKFGETRRSAARVIDRGVRDYHDRLKKLRSGSHSE